MINSFFWNKTPKKWDLPVHMLSSLRGRVPVLPMPPTPRPTFQLG